MSQLSCKESLLIGYVRMWEVFLRNKGFSTLYFNVWDNDYTIDSMVSLMAQLLKLFKQGVRKRNVKSVISASENRS